MRVLNLPAPLSNVRSGDLFFLWLWILSTVIFFMIFAFFYRLAWLLLAPNPYQYAPGYNIQSQICIQRLPFAFSCSNEKQAQPHEDAHKASAMCSLLSHTGGYSAGFYQAKPPRLWSLIYVWVAGAVDDTTGMKEREKRNTEKCTRISLLMKRCLTK